MEKTVIKTGARKTGRPHLPPVINEIKLSFPSLSVNEGASRAAVGAFIARLDPTPSELTDLKCALSEAVTNCIVHAYPDIIGIVRITVRIREDRTVQLEVRDCGIGIPDIPRAREPLFTTDAAGERSGMGFTVMESFTDKVRIVSRPGRGTTVVMTKRLSPRPRSLYT